jgi:hypothetical protein
MIEFFLARRVLANLLTLFLSVEGVFAFLTTRWEMIPEFAYFTVLIEGVVPDDCGHGSLVGFPDASPHDRVFHGSRPFKRVDVTAILDEQHRYTPPVRQMSIPGCVQVLNLGMDKDAEAALSTAQETPETKGCTALCPKLTPISAVPEDGPGNGPTSRD